MTEAMLVVSALVAAAAVGPCAGRGTVVYVDTTQRMLWLCESGQAKDAMPVKARLIVIENP